MKHADAVPTLTGIVRRQVRRRIFNERGIQKLCLSCKRECKVSNAPNSTFKCFMREEKESE